MRNLRIELAAMLIYVWITATVHDDEDIVMTDTAAQEEIAKEYQYVRINR